MHRCRFSLYIKENSFLSYFENIAHMSVVWAYVSLWLCMSGCLLQEPIRLKVLVLMVKNQWDLGIYLNTATGVWKHTLNILMIQTLCTVMQLFKGLYFSVDATSRHLWPNLAIVNSRAHVFMSCVWSASLGEEEYKRSCIFKALPMKQ